MPAKNAKRREMKKSFLLSFFRVLSRFSRAHFFVLILCDSCVFAVRFSSVFSVYSVVNDFDENHEPTEVATDVTYLKKLCESSGGRLLQPEELGNFVRQLSDERAEASPQTRLVSAWDRVWFFWVIGLCFAADWFLRRRWGLS